VLRILGIVLYSAGVVNKFTFDVSGSFLDAVILNVAIQERFSAHNFISSNWKLIVYIITYSIVIISLFIAIKIKLSFSYSNKLAINLLMMAIIANIFLATYTDGRRSAFYGYNAVIESAKAISTTKIPYAKRANVAAIECTQCPDIIFYIIDESVNYEALVAIKSILLQESVIRKKLRTPVFIFKGYSAGNHSSVSNYILRLAVGKSAYPDNAYATLRFPSIFSYAKASHYKTVFYDAQQENNRLQNLMSQYDLVDIDYFITSSASSDRYNRDMLALERLRGFIDQAAPNNKIFILLVKEGVHFPYVNSIPSHLITELPEDCQSPDTSFSSQKTLCKKAQYEAALRFSVDQFMEKLFSMLVNRNFALIYTSDHGQNLSSKYSLPHGSLQNTSQCEISVPIFIAGNLFRDAIQNSEIKSHFQIPPTLLHILGHTLEEPEKGTTLWNEWCSGSEFLYEPFGHDSQWREPVENCIY